MFRYIPNETESSVVVNDTDRVCTNEIEEEGIETVDIAFDYELVRTRADVTASENEDLLRFIEEKILDYVENDLLDRGEIICLSSLPLDSIQNTTCFSKTNPTDSCKHISGFMTATCNNTNTEFDCKSNLMHSIKNSMDDDDFITSSDIESLIFFGEPYIPEDHTVFEFEPARPDGAVAETEDSNNVTLLGGLLVAGLCLGAVLVVTRLLRTNKKSWHEEKDGTIDGHTPSTTVNSFSFCESPSSCGNDDAIEVTLD